VFAKIPVIYQGIQFYLHRIIAMPVYSPKSQKGIVVENRPAVLSVTADRQTFVELKEDDALRCFDSKAGLCKFHTAVMKKWRPSCAFAIFQNDSHTAQQL
jgi:hypothetical protein